MEGCYYASLGAAAFGWTQAIPAVVGLCFLILSTATHEPFYFMFSTFLYLPQVMLWCFQNWFQYARPDPVCQLYHTWAFPSVEAFYVAILVVVFVAMTYFYKYDHSFVVWLMVLCFGIAPPIILVWTRYNRWWEVAFSMGFGFAVGLFFVCIFVWHVMPVMPYLQCHFPLRFFGYHDSLCMTDAQRAEAKKVAAIFCRSEEGLLPTLYGTRVGGTGAPRGATGHTTN